MNILKRFGLFARFGVLACICTASALAQNVANYPDNFQLHSSEFVNQGILPLTAVFNNQVNGVNSCSANGAAGGNQSPELFWTGALWGTQSYMIVLYDVTASLTHWGMYNIDGRTMELPANAGVAGNTYGMQIVNDFNSGTEYNGPCPPANVAPEAHQYVFAIYALKATLHLPTSANFPANKETLYHALINAGEKGDILGTASLTGYYSSTPQSSTASK